MRLVNPLMRRLVGRGRAGDQILLLHYVGRRTGRQFDVPAGYQLIDGVISVFTNSGWRHNFANGRKSTSPSGAFASPPTSCCATIRRR